MNRRDTVLALAALGAFPLASVGQQARAFVPNEEGKLGIETAAKKLIQVTEPSLRR